MMTLPITNINYNVDYILQEKVSQDNIIDARDKELLDLITYFEWQSYW